MYLLDGLLLSITLILSFLGWGLVVSRCLLGKDEQDWPFQAAWGVCLVMCLGGVFTALSLVSPALNLGVIALGLMALFFLGDLRTWPARFCRGWRETPEWMVLLTFLGLFCAAQHLSSLSPVPWNSNDDSLAYAAFPRKLLDTGGLIEPFSWRRLAGYGGFVYLHSLVLSVLSPFSLHLVDLGVMGTLSAFATAYYARRQLNVSPIIAGLAGLAIAYWTLPRINLSPASILSLLSLSLLHAVRIGDARREFCQWRPALLIGLVAAGLASVRVTALAFLLPFMGLVLLCAALRGRHLRAVLGQWVMAGCFTVLLLVPWALALYQSSNTPLWPLIQGNFSMAVPYSRHLGVTEELAWIWTNLHLAGLEYVVLPALFGVLVGALALVETCGVAAALVATLDTIHLANLASPEELTRYYTPFTHLAAVLTAVALAGFFLSSRLAKASRPAVTTASLLVCGLLVYFNPYPWGAIRNLLRTNTSQLLGSDPAPYTEAFARIPEGAKVLAELDWPCLLDYRRHVIYNIDQIGMVSPGRGLVLQGDPEGLLDYLRGQGIAYLVFVRPAKAISLYNRLEQEKNLGRENIFYRQMSPRYLWFFNAVEILARRYPISFEDDAAVVLPIPRKNHGMDRARSLPESVAHGAVAPMMRASP